MNRSIALPLLGRIEKYWSKRAVSYSEEVKYELAHNNEQMWMTVLMEYLKKAPGRKVLDIGTGPGFFAIGLAKRGYDMTAVDYTPNMLTEARKNAGKLADRICFRQMDAQNLDFEDNTFDAIVSRNLTWNLENPQRAYEEWHRVLKKGGVLLNFDAGWYSYLFDEEKAEGYEEDRRRIEAARVRDFDDYADSPAMEVISRQLILSRCKRPEADRVMLEKAGFSELMIDSQIGERVWDEREKINYVSRPMFLLCAIK